MQVRNKERKKDIQQSEVPEEKFRVLLTEIGLNDVAYNSRLNEVKSMRDDPSSGQYGGTSYTNISYLIGTAGVWTKSHQNESTTKRQCIEMRHYRTNIQSLSVNDSAFQHGQKGISNIINKLQIRPICDHVLSKPHANKQTNTHTHTHTHVSYIKSTVLV